MKKLNVLSLLMLAASIQLYGVAPTNAPLAFALACQAADSFGDVVEENADDIVARKLIQFINRCIAADTNLKQQLAASKNGYLFNGVPLDPAKIAQENKDLQDSIKQYDKHIKELKGSNKTMALAHKEKIKNRQKSREKQQEKLKENLAAIQANTTAENAAQSHAAMINNLIEQNKTALDQAIEYYIASFGQCYATKSGYISSSSIVISSKYSQNMPITPKEYYEFVAALNQASNQFGSSIVISLALNDGVEASIKDVASYVNNMAPASSSYGTYALVGLGVAAATVGAMILNNKMQNRDWNDTDVYSQLASQSYASTMNSAQGYYNQAYNYITGAQPAVAASNINPTAVPAGVLSAAAASQLNAAAAAIKASGNAIYDANQNLEGFGILAKMKQMFQSAQDTIVAGAEDAAHATDWNATYDDNNAGAGYSANGKSTADDGDRALLPYAAGAALGAGAVTGAGAAAGALTNYRVAQAFNAANKATGYVATPKLAAGAVAGMNALAPLATGAAAGGAAIGGLDANANPSTADSSMNSSDDAMWAQYLQ